MANGFSLGTLSSYTRQTGELFAKSVAPESLYDSVTVMPNVKMPTAVNLFSPTVVVQTQSCSPTASGVTAITQRLLTPCQLGVYDKFCVKDLEAYFTAEKLPAGSHYMELEFITNTYITSLGNIIKNNVELIAWQGNTDTGSGIYGLCNGFISILSGSTSHVKTGTTALTVSNIVEQINLMVLALPAAIAGKTLNIYLSNTLYMLFIQGWAAKYSAAPFYLDNTKKAHPFHSNLSFKPQYGLEGTNYIIIAEKSNMFYGVDLNDEYSNVYFKEGAGNDNNVYVNVEWKQSVQIAWLDQIVSNI